MRARGNAELVQEELPGLNAELGSTEHPHSTSSDRRHLKESRCQPHGEKLAGPCAKEKRWRTRLSDQRP